MRKGCNGLSGLVCTHFAHGLLSGDVLNFYRIWKQAFPGRNMRF